MKRIIIIVVFFSFLASPALANPNTELIALNNKMSILMLGLKEALDEIRFLQYVIALQLGVIWGAYTWRLVSLAKNQRSLW